jgi:hypothetical protein
MLNGLIRIFHPTTAEYTFFSAAQKTFSRIHPVLGHQASLNKCKEIEAISQNNQN